MSGDLLWDSVALALHMDDVGLTDVKGNAMTLNGGVTRSATQSKFGGYAGYFDGVDDEVTNTSAMPELDQPAFSAQFWCWPDTQVANDSVVLSYQGLLIEYKPTGYADGFVINANGTRTACGAFAESAWHYIWLTCDGAEATVYINGIFIATVAFVPVGSSYAWVGGNDIGTNPDSAFTGYIDDVLITPGVERTDFSVPVAAFPDALPDPEGTGAAVVQVIAAAVGIVAPIGSGAATVRVTVEAEGEVYPCGAGAAMVRVNASAAGVVGRTAVGACTVRVIAAAVGAHGRFGTGAAIVRVRAAAVGSHGISGAGACTVSVVATAEGSTPIRPIGDGACVVRVVARAVGLGAPVEEDVCA